MSSLEDGFSYAASTGGRNSISSSFLTPPRTPHSDYDIPFRPDRGDKTSLTMKKTKNKTRQYKPQKRQHRKYRRIAYGNDYTTEQTHLVRCKSLEFSSNSESVNLSPGSTFMISSTVEGNARSRRWTLPSKALATRCFTTLRPTVKQATLSDAHESPAMITLRRATTNRKPKRNELTFFPEPHFGDERKGVLSYLVSSLATAGTRNEFTGLGRKGAQNERSFSTSSDGAHPTTTSPAPTVCTEITVEPSITQPGPHSTPCFRRRCSTKYMTETSTFEIIWDESDSSTATRESSSPAVSERRSSLAIAKLESQLARDTADSCRTCSQNPSSPTRTSVGSASTPRCSDPNQNTVARITPMPFRRPTLRELDTSSPETCQRKATLCKITLEEPWYKTLVDDKDHLAPVLAVGVFPPPADRRVSMIAATNRIQEIGQTVSTSCAALGQNKRYSLGSMLGSSSHARRRSSAFVGGTKRRNSANTAGGDAVRAFNQGSENDASPLLDAKAHYQIT